MEDLLLTLLKVILMAAVPVITSALTYILKRYVDAWIDKNTQEDTAKKLKAGVDIIVDSVNAVQQTYVDQLKKEDKFTKENQIAALAKAKNQAIQLMNTDIQNAIVNNYGNLNAFVETEIESIIRKNK